jgi:hypothetical protein
MPLETGLTMTLQIAFILFRGSASDWYFFPIVIGFAAISLAARYWRFFTQWLSGIRGRDWASVSAVVDVVSVVPQTVQTRYGQQIAGYLATLTYFYRNPELQSGEYSRLIDKEEEAQTWAASYKGKTVMVHVDPRDPSKSVLRKEEL